MNFNATEKQQVGKISFIKDLISKISKIENRSEKLVKILPLLNSTFPKACAKLTINELLEERFPTFLLFTEYYKLPGKISINQLRAKQKGEQGGILLEDKVFLALIDLASSNIDQLENINTSEHVIMELEAIGNRLTDEIFEYWTTNKYLEVDFRFDSAKLGDPPPFNSGHIFSTRIKNKRHRVTVPFDKRSTGFIWFFSFLVWFSQVKKHYGENLVILLDEPGLTLHGKAQADLLRYINEKLRPHHQVIYTTHSPFMIDPENILAVRTVEDQEKDGKVIGTKVGDKVLSTDKDTILPLQGALGYDITQTLFVGTNTVVVEGPSDLLYLKWFSSELIKQNRTGLDSRWTISPIGGIMKIGSFVALLYGQTKNIAIITDYESGGKSVVQKLRKNKLLNEAQVLTADNYLEQSEADLEDLIGREAFVKLVNTAYGLDGDNEIPLIQPDNVPERIIKEVENHFRILPQEIPEFDHYVPAQYLIENGSELSRSLPGLQEAFDRFENLLNDLNALIA